jgi:DNA-binding MarR family transcriptional regulator
MSQLAELLDLALPNATGIVTRMEEHGLVSRTRDETDRRLVLVRLTDRGRQLIEEREFMRRAHLVRVLAAMTAERRHQLIGSFRTFLETADRLRDCGELEDDPPPATTRSHQGVPLR